MQVRFSNGWEDLNTKSIIDRSSDHYCTYFVFNYCVICSLSRLTIPFVFTVCICVILRSSYFVDWRVSGVFAPRRFAFNWSTSVDSRLFCLFHLSQSVNT